MPGRKLAVTVWGYSIRRQMACAKIASFTPSAPEVGKGSQLLSAGPQAPLKQHSSLTFGELNVKHFHTSFTKNLALGNTTELRRMEIRDFENV